MQSYYIQLKIIKQIEVVDCENIEQAKNYVLEQLRENATFLCDDEIEVIEV